MSVRAGILALLAERPKYGYQLKSEFDTDTAGVWALNVGQVYTTLDRLERDGCVAASGADGEGRRLYHLTAAGHHELTVWFAEPAGEAAPPRDELLLKVLLATKTVGVDVQAVIDTEREALHEQMRRHRRQRLRLNGDGAGSGENGDLAVERSDVTAELLLDALLARSEASLRWLDVVEARVRAGRPRAGTPTDRTKRRSNR